MGHFEIWGRFAPFLRHGSYRLERLKPPAFNFPQAAKSAQFLQWGHYQT